MQAHLNKEQYAQALVLARELQQQNNWQDRATSWVNYIQAQTDGMNKNRHETGVNSHFMGFSLLFQQTSAFLQKALVIAARLL